MVWWIPWAYLIQGVLEILHGEHDGLGVHSAGDVILVTNADEGVGPSITHQTLQLCTSVVLGLTGQVIKVNLLQQQ